MICTVVKSRCHWYTRKAHNNLTFTSFPGVISAVTGIFPHSGEKENRDLHYFHYDTHTTTHTTKDLISPLYILLITNGPNQENTHKRHRNIEREDYYNIQSSNIFWYWFIKEILHEIGSYQLRILDRDSPFLNKQTPAIIHYISRI